MTFSMWFPANGDFPHGLQLPLQLAGSTVFLETRKPTQEEVDSCRRLELTSDRVWDPNSENFANDEAAASNASPALPPEILTTVSVVARSMGTVPTVSLCAIRSILGSEMCSAFGDSGLSVDELEQTSRIAKVVLNKRQSNFTVEDLASMWLIGREAAERTLQATTRRGVRTISRPLMRRLRTRQEHLKYNLLDCQVYTDTFFSKVKMLGVTPAGRYI